MSANHIATQKCHQNLQHVDTHTFSLSHSVSLRIYASTEPHNLKIADLQKGLILIIDGTEAVGEGTGFGLPVLMYSDETYFSASSSLYVSQRGDCSFVIKEFVMDRVARNSFRNVTLENRAARSFIERLSDLYQAHPRFRFLTLKDLTGRMSIGKAFLKAPSKGRVTVTYTFDKSRISVKADFKKLERRGLQKIFMLNEQGSGFFRRYTDSLGTELWDDKIGAWDGTGGEWACLQTLRGEIGFRLWRIKNGVLRRGREFLEGSLDWVGLDYEIKSKGGVFQYVIDVLESDLP
ncbi:MAG TPA: hypothetical protein VMT42_04995 [candidate division Zixibacteria bacterium]|nr:hypothetical protein [candidate division Zixibacteria bacterium]